jgi:DNA topoisomerase-3
VQDKALLKRNLEENSRGAQWLVLWLDCDREGENIAFEVGCWGRGPGCSQ